MCFAKKSYRDKSGSAANPLPPTRSECDVGVPVSEPTITFLQPTAVLPAAVGHSKSKITTPDAVIG